jgi:polar amino acid transport system permease protein
MFDLAYYQKLLPALTAGFWLSLKLIGPSAVLGLALGLVVGTVRGAGRPRFLAAFFAAYVSLFRGTALVMQLVVCYYGLPELGLWLKPICQAHQWPEFWRLFYFSPYAASVAIFALCSGAYHSEYIRGAILSIRRGQFLAARALGMTPSQTFWNIVLPQAVRRAGPGCGNEIIYLIKYSSLACLVSAPELTGAAKSAADLSFRYTESFFLAGLYYLGLVTLATWLLHRLEQTWAVPGFGRN